MRRRGSTGRPFIRAGLATAMLALCLLAGALPAAQAADPIRIGFSSQLTGALASSGKANLLAQEIWQEEINARGGLLGRRVDFIHYDDQSNPGLIPGIYTKLLDVDKVELLMGEGTNFLAPAMPIVMERKRMIVALLALAVNERFHYSKYFQTASWGPEGKSEMSHNFFEVAKTITPKPQTVALVGADAEFSNNVLEGARANAKKYGLKIVYDGKYPPSTVDYSPIIRAIQATKPDIVFVGSYPLDTVGMVRAAREGNLKTMMFGGGMVGLQYASIKTQLAESLERVLNYELYIPGPTTQFPGVDEFLKKYQARAREKGVDPLGYYQPPFSYAAMQVIEQAVTATGSLNDDVLSDYMHKNVFKTIVGEIKFDELGEWAKPRVLAVQFRNIKGNGLEQFEKPGTQIILYPPEYKTGDIETPLSK
jgi:branched-chain amino acid transport system substrate-binding protein